MGLSVASLSLHQTTSTSISSLRPVSLGTTLKHTSSPTFPRRSHVAVHSVRAQAESSTSSESPPAVDAQPKASSTSSPFAGKKISSLLAARRAQAQENKPEADAVGSTAASGAPVVSSSLNTPGGAAQQSPPLSPAIASLLEKTASLPKPPPKPASPFASSSSSRSTSVNAVPAGTARPVVSFGKKSVLDALKKTEGLQKGGSASVKMGQPGAPANIFVDEIRSKEQIEAEKFRLVISKEQVLLVVSFFASSIIMMGAVYIVWKLGAIHYNEI